MKSGWKFKLASWVGALGLALFVSNASHAAIFSFTGPDTQTSPSQPQIGGQDAGFDNNFSLDIIGSPLDLVISIVNVVNPSLFVGNIQAEFNGGGLFNTPLNVNNVGAGSYTVHIHGITGGTKDDTGSYQVQITATDVAKTPIPGAALLFGSGLAALGFAKRRKKGAQA
jgi:hypothetical protein